MKVLKFGGTSVGSVENLRKVKEIVVHQNEDVLVVVSALGGVTDKILSMARTAATMKTFDTAAMLEIETRHFEMIRALFPEEQQQEVLNTVAVRLDELSNLLKGVSLLGELTPRTLDRVGGCGELLSSAIIAPYLGAKWIDSKALIKTDSNYLKAAVQFSATNKNIQEAFAGFKGRAVAPGFVASNESGDTTTLGRGGSDYTGAIYAAALNAESLEIWTDVDGFMTADPRVISKAYVIDYLTYAEAMELSHFGAKVIYPPTILPVYRKKIPVWIKNTTNPDFPGTLIGSDKRNGNGKIIKGISSISTISLITLQGGGMVGVTGVSMRLFSALASQNINVILISQASSENSISVAVSGTEAKLAVQSVANEFQFEIDNGLINGVVEEDDLSIVAIVGENMKESPGIAGKLFNTIGKNGINVRAIAQGASELNISWVIKTSDLRKTLNVVHEGFFLSTYKQVNLFLMGIGTVGGQFLAQLQQQQKLLLKDKRLKIQLVGVANSKKMHFNIDGIALPDYKHLLKESSLISSPERFSEKMIGMNRFNSIFVDCTANEEVAGQYLKVLDANISVVAANKVAASSDYSTYKELKEKAVAKGVKFHFETNVGAGLPILSTIKDLVNSGDRILKIEAVLSGTLNYIFNTISKEVPLSKAIEMAKEAGFSEPDPRIDLSGKDVARKLLILARESGYEIEADQIMVEKFIPEPLMDDSMEQFWKGVRGLDEQFEQRRSQLEAENKKWRFVATFEPGNALIGLQEVDSRSPWYDLEGSNNIILLTTQRYNDYPMQIKGYGAGAGVTAAGVFADIMRIANI